MLSSHGRKAGAIAYFLASHAWTGKEDIEPAIRSLRMLYSSVLDLL